MAQLGSALRSGRRGRRFKSCYPDQSKPAFAGGFFVSVPLVPLVPHCDWPTGPSQPQTLRKQPRECEKFAHPRGSFLGVCKSGFVNWARQSPANPGEKSPNVAGAVALTRRNGEHPAPSKPAAAPESAGRDVARLFELGQRPEDGVHCEREGQGDHGDQAEHTRQLQQHGQPEVTDQGAL